ncbi:MAG: hypothetical protein LUD02_02565 [Tannerellaceae bacterium]|nr:hypothetical protein [Tannerellaceae bacterium]MCD8263158.1 hypothetical protein [Tannerellaceae bacterium]
MFYPGFLFGNLVVEQDTEEVYRIKYTVSDMRDKLNTRTVTIEIIDGVVALTATSDHYLTAYNIKGSAGIKVNHNDDHTITLESNNELFHIVTELPEAGEENIFYLLVNPDSEEGNLYDEYIWIENNWEKIGSRSINLSGYMALGTDQEITGKKYFVNDLKIQGNTNIDGTIYSEKTFIIMGKHLSLMENRA